MTYKEYIVKAEELLGISTTLEKQLNCIETVKNIRMFEKCQVGQEYLLTFDFSDVWDEYAWKVRKCTYFLKNYLKNMLEEIKRVEQSIEQMKKAMGSPKNEQNDELFIAVSQSVSVACYNFDAFILATCSLMDQEEKEYVERYIKNTEIATFYPNKKEIGLYWQLNLLRNRIVHHTGGRFDNGEVCSRFFDFSSRINGIREKNGHITMECTQIDVYRSKVVQMEILNIILTESRDNLFDRLFPDKKGKGHGKHSPVMIQPGVTLYFDHIDSGTRLIQEIQRFLTNMNLAFLREFIVAIKDKTKVEQLRVLESLDDLQSGYQLKDVFDMSKL